MRIIDRLLGRDSSINVEQVVNNDFVEQFNNYSNLMTLQDARQLLAVSIPGQQNTLQTMIVQIDFSQGTFSLDEFSPLINKPEGLVGKTITLSHHKNWHVLEIKVTIIDWNPQEQCYYAALPAFADYQPRRHHNRFLLKDEHSLSSMINPLYGAPWQAIIKDISQGGMRVAINGDLRPKLHNGAVLPRCQIKLDEQLNIECRGVVKSYRYLAKPARETEISIEFQSMTPKYRAHLEHFIDFIEVAA